MTNPLNIKIPFNPNDPDHYAVVQVYGGPVAEEYLRDLLPSTALGVVIKDAMRAHARAESAAS